MLLTTCLFKKEEGRKRERQRGRMIGEGQVGRKTIGSGGKEEEGDWSWVEMCTPESACPFTEMSWCKGNFSNFFLINKFLYNNVPKTSYLQWLLLPQSFSNVLRCRPDTGALILRPGTGGSCSLARITELVGSPPIRCVPVWADGRVGMGIKAGEGGREALCLSSLLEHLYAL